jgi:chloramphenicol-sensitive protein RarD
MDTKKGTLMGLGAYFAWAIFPVYFKMLQGTPELQILAHRVFWSFVLLSIILLVKGEWLSFGQTVGKPRLLAIYLLAAVLLALNWLIYIWAVNSGHILESSLGYFINPLVNVLLGVVFLRERLRPTQWVLVGLAALGVIYLAVSYGRPPWIALSLAFSFGFYGLVKKTAPLGSFYGLSLETGLLFVPAAGLLLVSEGQHVGIFGHAGWGNTLLLIGTGVMTTIPLLLFGSAARSIPLTTLGLLQYVAPTGQFLLGTLLYHEPFGMNQLIGFGMIWLALAFFWIEGYWKRKKPALPVAETV